MPVQSTILGRLDRHGCHDLQSASDPRREIDSLIPIRRNLISILYQFNLVEFLSMGRTHSGAATSTSCTACVPSRVQDRRGGTTEA